MGKMYQYIYENLKRKGIWHLCHSCTKCFGSCGSNPIFMSDLYEVPPPKNDSIIFCDAFKEKKEKYSTGSGIYCHNSLKDADCPGCFYFKKSKPEIMICNECGFKTTLEIIQIDIKNQ